MKKLLIINKQCILSLFLVSLLILAPLTNTFAAQVNDVTNHWGEEVISEWLSKDLSNGYPNGSFKPDNLITRAEFMTLTNKAFGFVEEEMIEFHDVSENAWYTKSIKIAKAVGYIEGYPDRTMKPNNAITRQEAAIIISKIKGLESNPSHANIFADAQGMLAWSKGQIGAVAEAGYMSGYPDESFKPENPITRAEALISLDRALYDGTWIIKEAGTYGPEEGTDLYDGDVIIKADGSILQNISITGDLIITEEVGEGEVTLNNVIVEGDTYIQGGGTDSIYINGGSYNNIIIQRTPSGAVRVVVTGQNRLNVEVDEEAEEQIVILDGFYDKVIITAPNVRIITRGGTQINELIITGAAKNTTLETSEDTIIEKAKVDGDGSVFEGGEGTVKELDGGEKENLEDKDDVVVKTSVSLGSGRRSSSSVDDEEYTITDAEVNITSGSIVFGYTFYDGDNAVTYLEVTQAPYYLDALNSHVELISGSAIAVQHFQQLNVTENGQVVYEDLNDIIASWWSNPVDAFVPAQIRIYLTPTDQGDWEAFEVVRDLTEGEQSLFTPSDSQASEFAGGDGTQENPYQVATAQQLNNVRNHLDKYFFQVEDINLIGIQWVPIGNSDNSFEGAYNGNDKTISNLSINLPDDDMVGLFGRISSESTVQNVILNNVEIIGKGFVGGLVGFNAAGVIQQSTVEGSVTGGANSIGGLVGENRGIVKNVNVDNVSVTGDFDVGGLVGRSYPFAEYDNFGMATWYLETGIIEDSHTKENVIVSGRSSVGGLVGSNGLSNPQGVIIESSSSAGTTGEYWVGGLIGANSARVEKSFSTGNVTGTSSSNGGTGGLVGYNWGHVENCYSTSNVSGPYKVGGLVGRNSNGVVLKSYSTGSVSGTGAALQIGGFLGVMESGTQEDNYWNTQSSGQDTSAGGTGYTGSQMKVSTNFSGWNFETIWLIDEGSSYPYLRYNEQIPHPQPPIG